MAVSPTKYTEERTDAANNALAPQGLVRIGEYLRRVYETALQPPPPVGPGSASHL